MAENVLADRYKSGHLPNLELIILDLHRLITIFLASPHLAELRTDLADDPIAWLQQNEEDEITCILINSAIIARIIDDRDAGILDKVDTNCGKLTENLAIPNKILSLNLREACNKIIHAKKINYDTSEINNRKYKNPILHFYGYKNGVEWKASLNVLEYVVKYIEAITI